MGDTAEGFKDVFMDQDDLPLGLPDECKIVIPTAPLRLIKQTKGKLNSWFDTLHFDWDETKEISELVKEKYD